MNVYKALRDWLMGSVYPPPEADPVLTIGRKGGVLDAFYGRALSSSWTDESAKIDEQALRSLARYGTSARVQQMPKNKPLIEISNADLVMEMLRRGFVVMKCPEPGVMPEALKDG